VIARCCREAKAGAFGKEQATMMTEAERVRELEKEVRELRMEHDIAKKATTCFAKYQT
jgi:transposase-like protein